MKICKKCNEIIPNSIVIDGKQRTLNSRKFCLNCRPFNSHNSSKFIDGTRPAFIDSLSNDEFNNLIKSSKSRSEVFDKLKMRKSGESFKILISRLFNRSHPVIRDIRDNKSYKQFLTEA